MLGLLQLLSHGEKLGELRHACMATGAMWKGGEQAKPPEAGSITVLSAS